MDSDDDREALLGPEEAGHDSRMHAHAPSLSHDHTRSEARVDTKREEDQEGRKHGAARVREAAPHSHHAPDSGDELLAAELDAEDEDEDNVNWKEDSGDTLDSAPKSWGERLCCEARDIKAATAQALNWYTALAVLGAFLASYYAVIGRHSHGQRTTHTIEGIPRNSVDMNAFVEKVRRLPTEDEMAMLKYDLMRSRSSVRTHTGDNITFGSFAPSHVQHGHSHMRMPQEWFDCAHIGISAWDLVNPNMSLSESQNEATTNLLHAIDHMSPFPTEVFDWQCYHNVTGWYIEGFIARFCRDHLKTQKAFVNGFDKQQFSRATQAMERLARELNQNLIVQWYPNTWGHGTEDDPLLHTSIVQEIIPVRTGMQPLRANGVTYRTNAALPPPRYQIVQGKKLS